ncbi:uncharacterized protein LOC133782437 isoform X2 [Humulus lupulus]|uniref:uncharacterized protein LOC133782437 isoform X2 n=1 Tax=Humulus lupulus TaxID=3486 RepID=UPI002B410DA3|nr:uncharacterized protein LOC133782437 isoform X2 [Humulus lupulus]
MADCEPPSFSLGFDFGFESEPQIPVQEPSIPPQQPAPVPPVVDPSDLTPLDDDGDKLGPEVADSDLDTRPDPPRIFKRLRRGPPKLPKKPPLSGDGEDDIEDFSSQEDILHVCTEVNPSAQQLHAMCSSSKIPLHGCGAIRNSSSQWKAIKNKPVSTSTASASVESSHNEKLFRNVTVSPLRKFQLIDSDSDDTSTSEEVIIKENHKQNAGHPTTTGEQIRKASDFMPQGVDLWKDFCPVKSVCTPVLDEFCEEYFRSLNDMKASEKMGKRNGQNIEQSLNVANSLLPAHRYFLHHDPRVRKLVHNRLSNFFPLGIDENSENQQCRALFIDYMGQFGNREAPKRQATQQVILGSSKRGRNKANEELLLGSRGSSNLQKGKVTQSSTAKKSSNKRNSKSVKQSAGEVFNASEKWVDPKQGSTSRKTSVKRSSKRGCSTAQTSSPGEGLHSWVDPRSSAQSNGQSVGHWFTGSDGRKVYVNKNGQELTGQIAYRQYKKDRGAGSNKAKMKTSSKRKKT